MEPCIRSLTAVFRRALAPLALVGMLSFVLLAPLRAADGSGTVTGSVSNTATGNLLPGAKVEVPQLSASALTDNTGRYILNLPAGTHELVVSYTGLDTMRQSVTVSA